ncbi:thiamine pyrophosphate-dependent dehydrogenase E1 component subunit alpha [Aliidiomarina celeris]|uniref:thiamine pyrophosphate-dependent dehydrogenase E1 component subunit alpha n=1 Tax=Aliidiomarina celeris TaxID=2249428 RepID=UPI000DEADB0D|nr:thiamine pyrophosphate-dependent dehydrogenase E1 component subunit alpha [Aliidiomarina celeris]
MSEQIEQLVQQMCLIRHTETALLELFSQGKVRGTVHTCLGQEACAVGVVSALNKETDIIYSNHRGHGHYLAYSQDVYGLIAEILGLPAGICHGVGGSQHLQFNNFYTNGIQGAGVPITVGMALAEKLKGSSAIAVPFIGDGTFGEGAIYEAFNIAALWQAPVMFVVEFNHYAQSTPSLMQHAGDLRTRVDTYGIPVTVIDGMDVCKVKAAAAIVAEYVRAGKGPAMLFLETYRLGPHSKGDDDRLQSEIDRYRLRDPLVVCRQLMSQAVFERIEKDAASQVSSVIKELLA